MADNVVPTLAPEKPIQEVLQSLPAQSHTPSTDIEKEALFDSIAQEGIDDGKESQSSFLKTFFTGLLWFGYSIAIVVALALVWSAAKGLLKPLPR
jgi:hypothetical protein